jgi:hypothetical protein
VPQEDPVRRVLCEGRPPWEQVTIVAGRQGRAISVVQLRACGLSDKAIETATDKGHLHKVHRGVRAVGTPMLSLVGRYWAAILAVGPDAALADLSGGALLGVGPGPARCTWGRPPTGAAMRVSWSTMWRAWARR